ncbi:vWA domain-containing protein [Jiella sonneratiae]|uniref:VWA domain-containing protein n=1 Tax=Jiella sonneratiae TaxID=2816856 RepID=A0ABS3J3F0_9HYPH|nr:vWA domain-containing protein [Jiella sonneratiae]MBO0904184.1 VWA domain-containing protein [Jiella sonneratiae]
MAHSPSRLSHRIDRWVGALRRLAGDSAGNFGMMTGLAAIPLILALGGGVDVANTWRHKAEAQSAADAAVVAAAKYVGTDATERERLADMYFLANVGDDIDADVSGENLSIENGEYKYTIDFSVDTPFLSLMHVASLDVGVEAVSARANIPLDIVLVLDSSGSMKDDSRMVQLKAAVKLFLEQFNGAESGDAKVQAALIPFDTQVKLDATTMGTYTATASNPYATTNCSTITDLTDRAACVAAQSVSDPVVNCSALNASANDWDRYFCSPTRDGFKVGTTDVLTGCYIIFCTSYSYSAYKSGSLFVIERRNASISCGHHGCSTTVYGSTTRIYSATITTTTSSPVATKNNDTETANNDLILTSSQVWSGCVIDRTQPYDVQDDAPQSAIADTLYPKANCATSTLLAVYPLTTDLATLKTKVDAMQPSGNTNITIGVQWGMEAFTPTYPLAGANTDSRTQKVMIVLTDGNNTQNRWYGGSQASLIDARTAAACANAKKKDIELFTIRLMGGNETLLKACATDEEHYFPVTVASELTKTFSDIAERVLRIRIVS